MTQLVVSGNRIFAHGEDCFLSMGGTVICTETGRKFENATVVNHDGPIPCDIDKVGYEYHAGDFVPCAPFGKGTGNIAVFCNDSCKSLKDSGISASDLCKVKVVEYEGNGKSASLTVDGFHPLFAVISAKVNNGETSSGEKFSGTITPSGGYSVRSYKSASGYGDPETNVSGLQSWVVENTLYWSCPDGDKEMELNADGVMYTAVVIGLEVDSNG